MGNSSGQPRPEDLVGKYLVDDSQLGYSLQRNGRTLARDEYVLASVVEGVAPLVRVRTPRGMYTTDYQPQRLNVHVAADGRVEGVSWG